MKRRWIKLSLLTGVVICPVLPAHAAQPSAATSNPAEKRVYTPADFARFAPKTAYDMLAQVPSFTIRSADTERGLGQASENVLINGQRIANKSGRCDRPAAADVGAERRPNRDRPGSKPRHSRPVGSGRQHHPEGADQGLGPVRMGSGLSNQFHRARDLRRVDQLFEPRGAARLYLIGQCRLRPRRSWRPGQIFDANHNLIETARRDLPQRISGPWTEGEVRARRARLVGRQSDLGLHAILESSIPRGHEAANDR